MAFESKSIFELAKLKFIRVEAWVYRFINNCRLRERESGELKPGEIDDAEIQAVKSAQQEAFLDEYTALLRQRELPKNSKLLGLKPRLGTVGQSRGKGRLRYAEFLSEDARFPIILLRNNQVAKLIVNIGGFINPVLDNIWTRRN